MVKQFDLEEKRPEVREVVFLRMVAMSKIGSVIDKSVKERTVFSISVVAVPIIAMMPPVSEFSPPMMSTVMMVVLMFVMRIVRTMMIMRAMRAMRTIKRRRVWTMFFLSVMIERMLIKRVSSR